MPEEEPCDLGGAMIEGLTELLAWKRGELEPEVREVDPLPAERIRAIRGKVARSARHFERRFGIPAATLRNGEQGRRKPDLAARLLLEVTEEDAEALERAARRPRALSASPRPRASSARSPPSSP